MIHRDGLHWYVDWEHVWLTLGLVGIAIYYCAWGYCLYRIGLVINHFVVKYW